METENTLAAEPEVIFEEMVATLLKPGAEILAQLSPKEMDNLHCAVGIAGELDEFLEPLKEYQGSEAAILDRENVIEEMGDYEFYAEGLRTGAGITREQCKEAYPGSPEDVAGMIYDPQSFSARVGADLCIAAGDVLDTVKRQCFYRKELEIARLCNALGRIDRGFEVLRSLHNITFEEVIQGNVNKLVLGTDKAKARYAGLRYTDNAAQTRADKA